MMDASRHDRERSARRPTGASDAGPRVVDSADLFGERREVGIRHRGEVYRLRVTRNGKLILNK